MSLDTPSRHTVLPFDDSIPLLECERDLYFGQTRFSGCIDLYFVGHCAHEPTESRKIVRFLCPDNFRACGQVQMLYEYRNV